MKVSFANMDVNLLGNEIKVGDVFPNFKAVDGELNDFEFYSLPKGKKLVLSVPSIDTGTCDVEATKFMNYFKDKEYEVVVVSYDTPFAQNRWCVAKDNKKVKLVSEFRHNDFGKKTQTLLEGVGLLTRAVFVLDENNKVEYVEYVPVVSNEPNYEEALKYFK
ncbi:Thiol peroxidase [Mycoplasmopsis agalactiae 14628]|uniref:Thiol peroxidase n=1 Tax=Mycoplasmopsis agalactiae 14628 TaxID=1110504 RepID=I5D5Q2_MYCAA|nr:thiol peroxidase [Mycoplasmopsis agalactiae]EIN15011.1 Thiol peroxidase [Mycoplasmopsis agalactiae 14628]